MKTHKFARKPFYVDAVRVSDANMEEVAEWCKGTIEKSEEGTFIKVEVHRPLTERQTQAFVGDWVLFAGSGFKVYTPKAFDKSFEKVKTLTKEQADAAGIKVPHEKSTKPKKRPVPTAPKVRANPVLTEEQAAQLRSADAEADAIVAQQMPAAQAPAQDEATLTSTGKVIDPDGNVAAEVPPAPVKDDADLLIEEVLRSNRG